ncbi:hypothetical protein [Mucilaginibacter sp. OK283]|jgi:hypothetical protein|uniref:hypothetical protein n=1 Tax=Mucilaginibacter sp. OK283 TaxID=1881049 RepID=UPI0008C3D24E|nr:hypothetical protein [Mucilaginibacter sp. OK283]SEO79103.1 hypothetical protein SAMN05428947_10494 [Mucilaginibacter sp. OK283]
MEIIDMNGKVIQVTDLKLSLLQADDYRHYRHTDPAFAAKDEVLATYWSDIYQKLLLLELQTAQ